MEETTVVFWEENRSRWVLDCNVAATELNIKGWGGSILDVVILVQNYCDGEGDFVGTETLIYFESSGNGFDESPQQEVTTFEVDP